MTDIRKHGFESDAQWREYLQEIEEAGHPANIRPASDQDVLDDLAALRADVAALRERIGMRRCGNMMRWRRIVGAAVLLMLVAAAGR
ncbi:hypothetical protein [Shinella sp.]|uniref:hypothetical protein n=1 Tax=unclassified Shinella TaxID=2643062 RepID=UPI0028B1689E|nr:hypothetical protein [Shinella sp.]